MRIVAFAVALVMAGMSVPASSAQDTGGAELTVAEAMIAAMERNCLPKVAGAGVFPVVGVTRAEPDLEAAFLPGATGIVWRTENPSVVVVSPAEGYACQVVADGIDRAVLTERLTEWSARDGIAADGSLRLATRDQIGVVLYATAEDGGFVQIHVANLPGDRVGALFTRSDANPAARRLLSQ